MLPDVARGVVGLDVAEIMGSVKPKALYGFVAITASTLQRWGEVFGAALELLAKCLQRKQNLWNFMVVLLDF